jgi:hypothetical protein
MRFAGLLLVFLTFFINSWAQEVKKDSASVAPNDRPNLSNDSSQTGKRKVVTIETYAKRFDPRKALFYSAVLPGAGQAYNKKYWKIPLIYGGFAGLIAVVRYYDQVQANYKNKLFDIINYPDIPAYPGITNAAAEPELRSRIDYARRQRDYFMILTGLFYILQMVDAHVDAHLKEFDLNPKLQVRIEPQISPMNGIGMGLSVRF